MPNPIACLISDVHLCHTAPVARSAEPDWYAAQARVLEQVHKAANPDGKGNEWLPIVCSGDVFDRWNSPPQLINFAIDYLPRCYAIPGQHDLPNHSLDLIERSAYWTLVQARVIEDWDFVAPAYDPSGLRLIGFPWGDELSPIIPNDDLITLAVVHRYLYTKSIGGYPHAPKENRLDVLAPQLAGYDVCQFGDNHTPFSVRYEYMKQGTGMSVVNCGCLQRRSIAERSLEPSVWLLRDDASVERIKLDTSEDKWLDVELDEQGCEAAAGLANVVAELEGLQADSLDFRAAVKRWLRDNDKTVSGRTKTLLMEIVG